MKNIFKNLLKFFFKFYSSSSIVKVKKEIKIGSGMLPKKLVSSYTKK